MSFDLNSIAQMTVILAFMGAIFNFVILKPLKLAIEDLRDMIAALKFDVEEDRKERHALEVKLARVEDSAKSAHHRIDTLEQRGSGAM